MTSPESPVDFKSPKDTTSSNISGTQSPASNPFDDILKKLDKLDNSSFKHSPYKIPNTSFKDIDRPSLAPLDLNSSDFVYRESLGILPNSTLARDSLTAGIFDAGIRESLDFSNLSIRESLGVLNLSAMDLGRESIGIFNIKNSFLRRISPSNKGYKENVEDFNSNTVDNAFVQLENDKLIATDNLTLPEILLSTTEEKINSASISGLNTGFLFPHSRKISAISSGSSSGSMNPLFNSHSLEGPSKIFSLSSFQKDIESSLMSEQANTDPFNEAFQTSSSLNINKHSVTSFLPPTSPKNQFTNKLEHMRNRIQSLPVTLEENLIGFDINMCQTKTSNFSLTGLTCRGVENEKELDESVFLEAKKVASFIADTSFCEDEKSFNLKEHNFLDSTPQPDWPEELDSSVEKPNSPKCDKDVILKKVDKMLGMQPACIQEKLMLKNSKSDSVSSEMSENISKISRASQDSLPESQSCASNNFSQNLSKISQASEENVSRLIKNLSDIIHEHQNLSTPQKNEGRHLLNCLADMFRESRSKTPSSEDSGHSSVEDQQLEENKENLEKTPDNEKNNLDRKDVSENSCQALDLSCRNKSCSDDLKGLSKSFSPAPVRIPSSYMVRASNNYSVTSNGSNTSNISNISSKNTSVPAKTNSITKVTSVTDKLRSKSMVAAMASSKKGPLRAILPVENMAKGGKVIGKGVQEKQRQQHVTPERNEDGMRFGLRSKRTSTPIQEPKLKPMAASTPATQQSKESKECAVSPLARPKYTRSFSYKETSSSTKDLTKSRESVSAQTKHIVNKSVAKVGNTKLVRRNSVSEGVANTQKNNVEGSKLKRSFSTGKEPKIMSALNKVRQNILNSPYYNPRKSGAVNGGKSQNVLTNSSCQNNGSVLKGTTKEMRSLSLISSQTKPGKENVRPLP